MDMIDSPLWTPFWLAVAVLAVCWLVLAGVSYYRREVRKERAASMARHPAGKGR